MRKGFRLGREEIPLCCINVAAIQGAPAVAEIRLCLRFWTDHWTITALTSIEGETGQAATVTR